MSNETKTHFALITGAGSGIGAECARRLDALGFRVILVGRNQQKLEAVAAELNGAFVLPCDVASESSVTSAATKALSFADGPPHVLVNNAGVFATHDTPGGTDHLWREQFEINLFGAVRWTRAFWSHWIERRQGASVVNVSSTLGLRPTVNTGAYSAAKAAMVNWTQSLALEGGPFGIRANVVCPGIVDTPIHSFHGLPEQEKRKQLEAMAKLQPLGRIGTPEDVARAVVFLASPESSWTTGAVLAVDGGINLS